MGPKRAEIVYTGRAQLFVDSPNQMPLIEDRMSVSL
jgi:hypothetical protein